MGTLFVFTSWGDNRVKLTMPAGSGLGTTRDTCVTNVGPLPDGVYNTVTPRYKTDGSVVVRGWVWQLNDMRCPSGVLRTGLFVHSNGIEGTTWNGNYQTNGCVKISQEDRYGAQYFWNKGYLPAAGKLVVLD